MISCLLLAALLAASIEPGAEPKSGVAVSAEFLNRADLPSDIDFPLLELGFAVVRVRIDNQGEQEWLVKADSVEVRDRKGKTLKPASLNEMTPKIMKHGKSSRRLAGVGAEIGTRNPNGYPGAYPGRYPTARGASYPGVYQPPIPANAPPRTVQLGEAQRIRGVLEGHQITETTLQPGQSLEALLYLKSKKPASELSGGQLLIAPLPPVEVQ